MGVLLSNNLFRISLVIYNLKQKYLTFLNVYHFLNQLFYILQTSHAMLKIDNFSNSGQSVFPFQKRANVMFYAILDLAFNLQLYYK